MCEHYKDENFDTDIILGDTDIKRYGIYYCNLEIDLDSDNPNPALIGKVSRPCMVISPTHYNRRKNKLLVLPFCSNNTELTDDEFVERTNKSYVGDIIVPIKLNRDETSFLIVSQPRPIFKRNIGRYIGRLDKNKTPDIVKKIMKEMNYLMIDDYVDTDLQRRLDTSSLYDIRTIPKESLIDYIKSREDLKDILINNAPKRKYTRVSNEDFSEWYVKYRNGEITPKEIANELDISYGTAIRKIKDAEGYLNNKANKK